MALLPLKILTIDIGGSHIKATILNESGEPQMKYERQDTPDPPTPDNMIKGIRQLIAPLGEFDKVSVGFPGYVKNGFIKTAPNLDNESWKDFDLAGALTKEFGKPTQVVNDADLQGLGVCSGKGLEMVVTLGTGFGTALLLDGKLLPHLELSHHPISKGRDYDQYIGEEALEKEGEEKWNQRMQKVLKVLKIVVNYDRLFISGGNAKKLDFPLDENIKIVSNKDGIKGGARLWSDLTA